MFACNEVNLGHELIFRLGIFRRCVAELTTGPRRQRDVLQEVLGRRAEPLRGNLVVWKGSFVDRINQLSTWKKIGKIPVTFCLSGDKANPPFRCSILPGTLIGAEEEELVFDDGSANATTKLVTSQTVVLLGEKISGVQAAVAQEFESCAVNCVRAGLGDNVDRPADSVAVLSSHVVRLEVEFLNGVGIRKRQIGVQVSVIVAGAIKLIVDSSGAGAIDGGLLLSRIDTTVASQSAVAIGNIHRSCGQENQGLHCSSIQRKVNNPSFVHELADRRGSSGH